VLSVARTWSTNQEKVRARSRRLDDGPGAWRGEGGSSASERIGRHPRRLLERVLIRLAPDEDQLQTRAGTPRKWTSERQSPRASPTRDFSDQRACRGVVNPSPRPARPNRAHRPATRAHVSIRRLQFATSGMALHLRR
jgi:hypothetical protein